MSDKCQAEPTCGLGGIREAVCIHTKKICDACIDKDCIEDLRVYLTRESQAVLDQSTTAKARTAELLCVLIDVQPLQFNNGHFSVDITYYYRIVADAVAGVTRPCSLYGLAVFTKRLILAGGQGGTKIFSSKSASCNNIGCNTMPEAIVEALDPMILSAKVVDVCNCCRNDCLVADLPAEICSFFDSDLVQSGESKRLYVTIGQFSTIRLERDTQLLIPTYDYCIPTKDCSAVSSSDEDPCEVFNNISFPVNSFFPPCGNNGTTAGASTSNCNSNSGTSNNSNCSSSSGSSNCGCYRPCK